MYWNFTCNVLSHNFLKHQETFLKQFWGIIHFCLKRTETFRYIFMFWHSRQFRIIFDDVSFFKRVYTFLLRSNFFDANGCLRHFQNWLYTCFRERRFCLKRLVSHLLIFGTFMSYSLKLFETVWDMFETMFETFSVISSSNYVCSETVWSVLFFPN